MNQPKPQVSPTQPVTPEMIPDVEIGLGAGKRSKNFSTVDPSKQEPLPGKEEPIGNRDELPGADEILH